MRKSIWMAFAVSAACLYFSWSPSASAACNADSDPAADCLEHMVNGAKETVGADSDPQKAQSVGEAVKECWNCATETLSDKLRRFGQDSNGN